MTTTTTGTIMGTMTMTMTMTMVAMTTRRAATRCMDMVPSMTTIMGPKAGTSMTTDGAVCSGGCAI